MSAGWTESALERLKKTSGRSGSARREVVELLGRQTCCLSAQEIHDGLRDEGARVGIASVYRALEGLDRSGLVQRIDLGDGIARYEPAHDGGDHHHHFVCDDCGKVEPFEDAALEAALARIAGGRGYALEAHEVVLHGGCGACRPPA
jgi:Fur family ferric uptake transcriptional regulator